jgi:hypothetical protein
MSQVERARAMIAPLKDWESTKPVIVHTEILGCLTGKLLSIFMLALKLSFKLCFVLGRIVILFSIHVWGTRSSDLGSIALLVL